MEFKKIAVNSVIKISNNVDKQDMIINNRWYNKNQPNSMIIAGVNNKLVKRIVEISKRVVHSDVFYLVIAGGYAINSFQGNERNYHGDADFWICVKKIVTNIKQKADEFINAILQEIYAFAGTAGEFINNSAAEHKYIPSQQIRKGKDLVNYSLASCVKSINAITLKLSKTKQNAKHFTTIYRKTSEIQFILRIYNSPEEILNNFDLDCCKIAYIFNEDLNKPGHYLTSDIAIDSMMNEKIYFNPDILNASYYNRLVKYFRKGYSIIFKNFNYNMLSSETGGKLKIGRLMFYWSKRDDNRVYSYKIALVSNDNVPTINVVSGESYQIDEENVVIKSNPVMVDTRNFIVSNYPIINIQDITETMRLPTPNEITQVSKINIPRYPYRGIYNNIDLLDKSDINTLLKFIQKKAGDILREQNYKKSDKFLKVISQRVTDIQKIYYTGKSTNTVTKFNENSGTPEKRWRFIDEIPENRTKATYQELYNEYLLA